MEGWSIHKATERETGRGKQKEAQWDRQRYTAIRTLVFYPSLIGKPSTVNSALKLDIDPLPPLPLLSLSPYMSLSSFGTPHFPFCWFRLHLVLLSLFLFISVPLGIPVIYEPLIPSLASSHMRTDIRMRYENEGNGGYMSKMGRFEISMNRYIVENFLLDLDKSIVYCLLLRN